MIEYNVVGESSVREEMGNVIIQNKIRLKVHEALNPGKVTSIRLLFTALETFYFDKDGTKLGC